MSRILEAAPKCHLGDRSTLDCGLEHASGLVKLDSSDELCRRIATILLELPKEGPSADPSDGGHLFDVDRLVPVCFNELFDPLGG
jgi:hypothetical protein